MQREEGRGALFYLPEGRAGRGSRQREEGKGGLLFYWPWGRIHTGAQEGNRSPARNMEKWPLPPKCVFCPKFARRKTIEEFIQPHRKKHPGRQRMKIGGILTMKDMQSQRDAMSRPGGDAPAADQDRGPAGAARPWARTVSRSRSEPGGNTPQCVNRSCWTCITTMS